VEAVAPHSRVVQLAGKGEHLRELRLSAMERRVEARHLGQVGPALEQEPDRRQVVGLVQRGERNELRQVFEHRAVDAHRFGVPEPAVHDAVPDARELQLAELLPHERHDVLQRAIVAELAAFAQVRVETVAPAGSLRRSAARCDGLGLAAHHQPGRRPEQRELDARRAGVENRDRLAHHAATVRCRSRAAPWPPGPPPRTRPDASRPSRPGW
jgi:hypothetical protein